mgnify:CR=1 FL=1
MIDTTPFEHKLSKLIEYINIKVDGVNPVLIDIKEVPPYSYDDVIMFINSTGNMLYSSGYNYNTIITPIPFEEWYQSQNQINK